MKNYNQFFHVRYNLITKDIRPLILILLCFWSIDPLLAHVWEIRVNANPNNTLTWYAQSYHSVGCGIVNSGLTINGTDYPFESEANGSIVGLSSNIFMGCGPDSRASYAVVTTPYLAGVLTVNSYSPNACWFAYCPNGSGMAPPCINPSISCPPDVTVNAAPNSCQGYVTVGLPEVSGCGHNALDFDGINDGVAVANGYSGSDEITIEMWINPRVINDWDVFVNHDTWNENGKIHYQFFPNGVIEFSVYGNDPIDQFATVSPGVNQWSHIAAVYSKVGKYVRFYLNGVFTNQANYTTAQTIGVFPYRIGNWNGSSRFFDGKMDEIRIWNVLRTDAQISSNMNKCLEGNEAGLLAYFSCNHGLANGSNAGVTTLEDQCPEGGTTNGTLNNFALTGGSSNWVLGAPAVLPSTTNNYNNSPDASDNYPVGKNKITWTVSDCEGNSATCEMKVTVNGCNAPIQVYHSDTTQSEAKINWKTQDDCANGFRLRIRKELSPGMWGSWSSWTNKSGPGLKHLFTGLIPSGFYHYQIQSKCSGVNSSSVNGWFHTLGAPPPLKKSDKDITEDVFVFDKAGDQRNAGESTIVQITAIPNPASDNCTLQLQGFDQREKIVTMLDLFGKMVLRVKLPASENNPELDLRKLNVQNGAYLFHVDDGQNRKTVQLIIQR